MDYLYFSFDLIIITDMEIMVGKMDSRKKILFKLMNPDKGFLSNKGPTDKLFNFSQILQ